MTDARTAEDISFGPFESRLADLADRLARSYSEVSPDTVSRLVRNESGRFAGARVQVFVPILVERAVRKQLDQWATR
jgi:hypothetical protein